MSETTTEIVMSSNSVRDEIANMATGRASVFSTISGDGFAPKAALLEALSNSEPLSENLEKNIQLVNVVVEAIDLVNEATGEMGTQPRVILIDADGTAYHAISPVVLKDVQRLLAVLGHPQNWPVPVGVKATKGGKGNRQYFTLKLDTAPAAK